MKRARLVVIILALLALSACVSVKPYQKAYLNDEKMELSASSMEIPESTFQVYREGASGASSGKTGGGCGCN